MSQKEYTIGQSPDGEDYPFTLDIHVGPGADHETGSSYDGTCIITTEPFKPREGYVSLGGGYWGPPESLPNSSESRRWFPRLP